MSPQHAGESASVHEHSTDESVKPVRESESLPPLQIVWRNVFQFLLLNVVGVYSLSLIPGAKWQTTAWAVFLWQTTMLGTTAGTHRLWSHRAYKARFPLRVALAIMQTAAFQNCIFEWSRDHRVHHKGSETNADPHNAKRGFFFSHIGWLMVKKQKDVVEKGKQLDLSDLYNDGVVMFQKRHYFLLVVLFWFGVPSMVPWYFWGETYFNSVYVCVFLRYWFAMNCTFLVNSAAHIWGNRPYDTKINPAENRFVSFFAAGEGFHNFHHTFPHDYSTSELPWTLNVTTLFIDACAAVGLVYDRKRVSKDAVNNRRERTGDLAVKG